MKKYLLIIGLLAAGIILFSCEDDDSPTVLSNLKDVKITVSFSKNAKAKSVSKMDLTKETPTKYVIALKSATLVGVNETSNFELFNEPSLVDCFVFDFTDENIRKSLLADSNIPDGEYSSIKLEIYYLQMNIGINAGARGLERRNFRIYMCDDAEFENGLHQPGDMTQINDGREIGWLLGEGQSPNMDPVTPRAAAYTYGGDGTSWYQFDDKNGANYGPFGNMSFWNSVSQPIYNQEITFAFLSSNGENLVVDFDVTDCWQFEDKSGDGYFGADDLDPIHPTRWHMELPSATVYYE